MSDSKSQCCTADVACFIFASSFVLAALYYYPHSIDTGTAWLITSVVTFLFAYGKRIERLAIIPTDTRSVLQNHKALSVAKFAVVLFFVWSVANLIIAIENKDGVEPESKWMSFIASMMGLKWSVFLTRVMLRLEEAANQNSSRRALLSPIGEIA